jgi:hypothetical protein
MCFLQIFQKKIYFYKNCSLDPTMSTFRLFHRCAVIGLALAVQTQVHGQARMTEVARYAEAYTLAAEEHAALFNGRIQEQLASGHESIYLRDRGYVERNEFGDVIPPVPVSPQLSFAAGNLVYDGVLYVGVLMRLDLCRDDLAVGLPNGSFFGVLLDPGRFGYADTRGYRIIHMPAPVSDSDLPRGYYLQLHTGRHDVLKKEMFQLDPLRRTFEHQLLRYYIEKDGRYQRVAARKGAVLRVLREHRNELNRYIRSERLDLRHDTERALVEIVRQYERLTDR